MSTDRPKVIVLSDRTVTSFCRELARLQESSASRFSVVDAGYDSWLREIHDPQSRTLGETGAAIAFILSPRVLEISDIEQLLQSLVASLDQLSPRRTVLFSNFSRDPRGAAPLLLHADSEYLVRRLNDALYAFADSRPWFHVVDQAGFISLEGLQRLSDLRYESSAQMYFSPAGQKALAAHWNRPVTALRRVQSKVLVTDMDNTLWRGVLGEDGPHGIEMGSSSAGWPYRRYQQSLLALKRRGIVLAIASKNNREEAVKILATHPDSLLRPDDFAVMEISWGPKSQALRRIAELLNLGLDSLVFVDDSGFEREEVRQALPMVKVLDFPAEASSLANLLSDTDLFDALKLTREDAERAASYAAEAQRAQLRGAHATPADFYRSLQLKLQISVVAEKNAARVHQLLMKTNQFNLTTERLSDVELRSRLADSSWLCLDMRVADKFGDSGLTGVAFVDVKNPEIWVCRNFLLSCRVIGRTVEHAFVSWLAERARQSGVRSLQFMFSGSERNSVALEFLERSGLVPNEVRTLWTAETASVDRLSPYYVEVSFV